MGLMKKLKLFPSCTQHPRTASFRATTNSSESSWFTNSVSESPSWSTTTIQEDNSTLSYMEAVIRGAQQAGRDRLLFEPWAPRTVKVAIESQDPKMDFKKSMVEMVESLGLVMGGHGHGEDYYWEGLEEMLCCFLKVNEICNHGYILAAFVELLHHYMY